MEPVMPFCVSFLESTVDALLALVGAAMTLVASLVYPTPGQPQMTPASAATALVSYVAGQQDASGLAARLRDADPRVRAVAACDLQRLGSGARGAIAALVERLPDGSPVDPKICGEDRHYWSRDFEQPTSPGEEAAAALVAIGTESLPSLVTAVRAPQWIARRNAVWALGALDDARGVTPVLGALTDREPPVRRVAAWALGALDADVAVTALIDALRDSDASVRSQVAWALGAIRDARAVDGLINALKDQDEAVRAQAAWALGAIRDRRASDALAGLLKDSSPRVRRQAAWALGTIGR
jgi:HEAT repeat protein